MNPLGSLEAATRDLATEVESKNGKIQPLKTLTSETLTAHITALFDRPDDPRYQELMVAYSTRHQLNRLRLWWNPRDAEAQAKMNEDGVMQSFYEYIPNAVVHHLREMQTYLDLQKELGIPADPLKERNAIAHINDLSTVVGLRTLLGRYGQLITLRNEMQVEHGLGTIVRNLNAVIGKLKEKIKERFNKDTAHTPGGALRIRTPSHRTAPRPAGTRPAGNSIEIPVAAFIDADTDPDHFTALRNTDFLLDLEISWLMSGEAGVPGFVQPPENLVTQGIRALGGLPAREIAALPSEELTMDLLERALQNNVERCRKLAADATPKNRDATRASLARLSEERTRIIAHTVAFMNRLGRNRLSNTQLLSLRHANDLFKREGVRGEPGGSASNQEIAKYLERELKTQMEGLLNQMNSMIIDEDVLNRTIPEGFEDLFNGSGRQAAWRTLEGLVAFRLAGRSLVRSIPGVSLIGDIPYVGRALGLNSAASERSVIMREVRISMGYPANYDPLLSEEENRTRNGVTLTDADKARIRDRLKSTVDVRRKYVPLFERHRDNVRGAFTALTSLRAFANPDTLVGVEPAALADLQPHLVPPGANGRVTEETVRRLRALPAGDARNRLCMAAYMRIFAQIERDWGLYMDDHSAYLTELNQVIDLHFDIARAANDTGSMLMPTLATLGGVAFLWWVGGRGGMARVWGLNTTLRWGRIPMAGGFWTTIGRGIYRIGNAPLSVADRVGTAVFRDLMWNRGDWRSAARSVFWDPARVGAAEAANIELIQKAFAAVTVARTAPVGSYVTALKTLGALEAEAEALAVGTAGRATLLADIAATRLRLVQQAAASLGGGSDVLATHLQRFQDFRLLLWEVDKVNGVARIALHEAIAAGRARLITATADAIARATVTGEAVAFFRGQASCLAELSYEMRNLLTAAQAGAQAEIAAARGAMLQSLSVALAADPGGLTATGLSARRFALLGIFESEAVLLPAASQARFLQHAATVRLSLSQAIGLEVPVARAALMFNPVQRAAVATQLLNARGGAGPILQRLGFTSLKQFTDIVERVHLLRHEDLLRQYAALDAALASGDQAAIAAARSQLIGILHEKIDALVRAGVSEDIARELVRRGICGLGGALEGARPLISGTGGLASEGLAALRAARVLESAAVVNTTARLSAAAQNALTLLSIEERLAILRAVRMSPHLTATLNALAGDELLCAIELLRSPGIRTALAGLTSEAEILTTLRGMLAMETAQLQALATRLAAASTAARPGMLLEATRGLAGAAPKASTVRWLARGAGNALMAIAPVIEGVIIYANIVEYQRLQAVRKQLNEDIESMFSADHGYTRDGNKFKHAETGFEVDAGPVLTMSDEILAHAMVDTGVAIGTGVAVTVLLFFFASNPAGWVAFTVFAVIVAARFGWDSINARKREERIRKFLTDDLDPRVLQFLSLEQITGYTYGDLNDKIGHWWHEDRARMVGLNMPAVRESNRTVTSARSIIAVSAAMERIRQTCPVPLDLLTTPDGKTFIEQISAEPFRRMLMEEICPQSNTTHDQIIGNRDIWAGNTMRLVMLSVYVQWNERLRRIEGRPPPRARGWGELPPEQQADPPLVVSPEEEFRARERVSILGRQYLGRGMLISEYDQARAIGVPANAGGLRRIEFWGDPFTAHDVVSNRDFFVESEPDIRSRPSSPVMQAAGQQIIVNSFLPVERAIQSGLPCYRVTVAEGVFVYFGFVSGQWMWSATGWPRWRRVGTALYDDTLPVNYRRANEISNALWAMEDAMPGHLRPLEAQMEGPAAMTVGISYLMSIGARIQRQSDGRVFYRVGDDEHQAQFIFGGGRWLIKGDAGGRTSEWRPVSSTRGILADLSPGMPSAVSSPAVKAAAELCIIESGVDVRRERVTERQQLGVASLYTQTYLRPVEVVADRFGVPAYSAPVNGNRVYFAFVAGRWMWGSTSAPRWRPVAEARYAVTDQTDDRWKADQIAVMLASGEDATTPEPHPNPDRNEKSGLSIILARTGDNALTRIAPSEGSREPVRYEFRLTDTSSASFAFVAGRWCWNDTGHPRWRPVAEARYDFATMTDRHRAANALAVELTTMEGGMREAVPARPSEREQLGIATLYAQAHLRPVTYLPNHLGVPAYQVQGGGFTVQFAFFGGQWHWNSSGSPRWWLVADARYSRENGGETPTDSRYKANQIAILLTQIDGATIPEPLSAPEASEKVGLSIILARTGDNALTRIAPSEGSREPVRYEFRLTDTSSASFAFVAGRWCWNDTGHPRWRPVAEARYDFATMTDRHRAANALAQQLMTMETRLGEPAAPRPDQREELGLATLFSQTHLRPVTFVPDRFGSPAYSVPGNGFTAYFAFVAGRWQWGSSGSPEWEPVSRARYSRENGGETPTDSRYKANQIAILLTAIETSVMPPVHVNPDLSALLGVHLLEHEGFQSELPPNGVTIFRKTTNGCSMELVGTGGRWMWRGGDRTQWTHIGDATAVYAAGNADAVTAFNRVITSLRTSEERASVPPHEMPALIQASGSLYLTRLCGIPRMVGGLTAYSRTIRGNAGERPWTAEFAFVGGRWLWKDSTETVWGHVGRSSVYRGEHPAVAEFNAMRGRLVQLEATEI